MRARTWNLVRLTREQIWAAGGTEGRSRVNVQTELTTRRKLQDNAPLRANGIYLVNEDNGGSHVIRDSEELPY